MTRELKHITFLIAVGLGMWDGITAATSLQVKQVHTLAFLMKNLPCIRTDDFTIENSREAFNASKKCREDEVLIECWDKRRTDYIENVEDAYFNCI